MTSEEPEHPPGLTRSQLRFALLIAIGITLVVAGTSRGESASSGAETDVAPPPSLPAKHVGSGPSTPDPGTPTETVSGGDATRPAPAA